MAKKESSVAPKERINVTFKPATGGAMEEIELPMKVMVMGDFVQRHDPRPLPERKPVSINKNNFAEVMAKQELGLQLAIPDVLHDGEKGNDIPVSLSFHTMRDFEPGSIVEQVPETQKLMRIRESLVSLKGPMGNMPAFRQALENVLQDHGKREEIQKELAKAGIDIPLGSKKKGKSKPEDKEPVE